MHLTPFRRQKYLLVAAGLLLRLPAALWAQAPSEPPQVAPSYDRSQILSHDKTTDRFTAVTRNELQRGWIYNYFDPRAGTRVWAIYQGAGRFSAPLGPGSIQPGHLAGIEEEQTDAQRSQSYFAFEDPPQQSRLVYVRLGTDYRWEYYLQTDRRSGLGAMGVPSIYYPDSGLRWEKHGRYYRPVSHTRGYRWTYREGTYVPRTE